MKFEVQGEIRRDATGFTQGLERSGKGFLESTGAIGDGTQLNRISDDGRVTTLASYGDAVFGEGLTVLRSEIFQLTWRDGKVFVYDLVGKRRREMVNAREGWGLTNNGRQLLFSDGSDRLFTADPDTFEIKRSISVRIGDRPVRGLNELEEVDGAVWANVFTTNALVRIEPGTGCVDAVADLSGLRELMPPEERARIESSDQAVLNGVAYDDETRTFYLTGKTWRTIFYGRFSTVVSPVSR